MYRIYFVLILSHLFTACDDSTSHHSHHDHGHSEVQTEGSVSPPPNPVSVIGGITVVEIGSGHEGSLEDADGLVAARYGRGVHLIRPDQHLAARWAAPTAGDIAAALARCARIAA